MKNYRKEKEPLFAPDRIDKIQTAAAFAAVLCLSIGFMGFYAEVYIIWKIFGGLALIIEIFLFVTSLIRMLTENR